MISAMEKAVKDLEKVCRCCLDPNCLASIAEIQYEGVNFTSIICELFSTEICSDDNMPKNICEKCLSEIIQFYDLRKKFKESQSRLQAILTAEPEPEPESVDSAHETTKKQYDCAECPKTFLYYQAYVNHMKTEHGNIDKMEPKQPPQKLICNICNKTYATKHSLKTHILTHGDPKFGCTECGKYLTSQTGLLAHLRIHRGEKRYVCQYCGKCFPYNGALKSHLRLHTRAKPYVCKICDKGFPHCSNMQRHMRMHTGEKPFLCNFCGKCFRQMGNLEIHKRQHTEERPHQCGECGKKFYTTSNLKRHQKVAH